METEAPELTQGSIQYREYQAHVFSKVPIPTVYILKELLKMIRMDINVTIFTHLFPYIHKIHICLHR